MTFQETIRLFTRSYSVCVTHLITSRLTTIHLYLRTASTRKGIIFCTFSQSHNPNPDHSLPSHVSPVRQYQGPRKRTDPKGHVGLVVPPASLLLLNISYQKMRCLWRFFRWSKREKPEDEEGQLPLQIRDRMILLQVNLMERNFREEY